LESSSLSKTTNSKGKFRILDIGSGSGCIALGLTRSLLNAKSGTIVETIGIDQSEEAVELARENTERCSLQNEVRIEKMDLFEEGFRDEVMKYQEEGEGEEEGGKGFDLIVSNPPYITREEFEGLDKSVKNWEDRKALVGESPLTTTREDKGKDDGLIFFRRITSLLPSLLRDSLTNSEGGPAVAFEVGKGQAREVGGLLRREGFKSEIFSDPWGVERAVFGWRR